MTRDLNFRLLESTSILENYLLKNQKLSSTLVQTKAEDLIYIDRPVQLNTRSSINDTFRGKLLERIASFPFRSGY